MKSTRCILSIILGLLAGWLPLGAVTVLKNLQVEYQTNPLMSVSHVLTGRWSPIAMGPVDRLIGYG